MPYPDRYLAVSLVPRAPARPGVALLLTLAMCIAATSACGANSGASAPAAPTAEPAGHDEAAHVIRYGRVVDLTHALHDDMAYWPGGVPFHKIKLVDYDKGYLLHKFETGENTGTHVDAPRHFVEGATGVGEIPLDQLVVPAAVIDVRDKVSAEPDYQLTAADVVAWEAEHGQIPAGALVILNTGWYQRFDEPTQYSNMDDSQVMHFPGYGVDSAKLLVERDVVGIGIDTLSLDYGPSKDFATHHVMLEASKYQIENLANLGALPATGATVVVAVLPVRDGSQAQARVLAFVP
ncbi:cyclase family protein [Haliangium sp.]|uniref:cyclase family protein n=1 Tax=Haliangium sp. TaxID=2663208 RepID=UPI003D142F05